MISTKWFQGKSSLTDVLDIRKKVFLDEMKISDILLSDFYDDFAFNIVVYENNLPVGTGRLLFKDGKYFIDMVCVIKEFRGNNYGDLVVRMLVRKAVDLGAENTYAIANEHCNQLFNNIGFVKIDDYGNNESLMKKVGDVGGHCCK